MGQGIDLFFTMAAVVGGPLLALMVVPALAKRVDFTERLLAQQREAGRLP